MSSLSAGIGIWVLLSASGLLSMIEIALVLCRESRLRDSDESGSAARDLARSPDAALSTVQAGLMLITVLTGALAAGVFAGPLAVWLRELTGGGGWVDVVTTTGVLAGTTVGLLWFGGSFPKRIGLAHPEMVVRLTARPLRALTLLAGPFVRGLDRLADATAAALGLKPAAPDALNEDDVKMVVREGGRNGALLPEESEMIEAVLGLDRMRVRELMTPRNDIVWLNADLPVERLAEHLLSSGHSRLPLFQGRRDNLLGVVSLRDVFAALRSGKSPDLRALARPPLLVPPTQPVLRLLETFRASGETFAVVADEHGGITGVVTMHDAVQAIVGDFQAPGDAEEEIVRRHDGSWLVDASVHPDDFTARFPGFPFAAPDERDYVTVNGYILRHLGRIPATGESFEVGGYRIEVVDLVRNRVDKVVVSRAQSEIAVCPG